MGNKGYVSKEHQRDLLFARNIRLETPKRIIQYDKEALAPIFIKLRKRIETLFFQLCTSLC